MHTNSENQICIQEGTSKTGPSTDEHSRGRLLFLKTPLDIRSHTPLVDVYITAVPIRLASSVLNLIRKLLPEDESLNIQHLRRFVKYEFLPSNLQTIASTELSASNSFSDTRFLITGPTTDITQLGLFNALKPLITNPIIWSTPIPSLPPTSQAQAAAWSEEYWPAVYKKANPFGPHPTIVSRAAVEIESDVEKWMRLASDIAAEASATGIGEKVGVVVVQRRNGVARLVAVAGDARWHAWPQTGSGNATAHAALRAIAMISTALQLREGASSTPSQPATHHIQEQDSTVFRDFPLTPIEYTHYAPSADAEGYLCHDLEIYTTHEPCVMCSMAILHSRFGRLVFGKRMPATGGICADGGLAHGLFWKRGLNWTMLAWEWCDGSEEGGIMGVLNA